MMRAILLVVVFIFANTLASVAQGSYRIGLLPQININHRFTETWELNTKIQSRQLLYTGTFREQGFGDFEYVLTDISILMARSLGGSKVAGGFLMRFYEDEIISRFIQGISIVRRYSSYRLGHRIAMDQTFAPGTPDQFRFRYRMSIDRALNGFSVDPGEFYFKASIELLNSLQNQLFGFEIRAVPYLGYAFTDNNKLELGFDYRIDKFIDVNGLRNTLWINSSWYLGF